MHKLFIIVSGGCVEEVYSTMSPQELMVEILDMDRIQNAPETECYLRDRCAAVREILYRLD